MSRETEILYKGSRVSGKHDTPECEPIYLTNAFNVADLDELDFVYDGGGFAYNRTCNPNRSMLAESMSYLEQGEDTLICNCGMSAITTALQTLVKAGDHILSDRTLYGETIDVISKVLGKFGVEVTYIDFSDLDEVRREIRPNTKVLYTETESNPMMGIVDIAAVAEIAHAHGCTLVVDNTFTTSYVIRPLEQGADVVVNSLTKFVNGHGDTLCGSITGSKVFIKEAYELQQFTGSVADPFSCWTVSRSIRTLDLRMERHLRNAAAVAAALEQDKHVTKVIYPGLPSHPQHELAKRIFDHGYGGMFSFFVPEDRAKINAFMHELKYVRYAMTLGGPRTTIAHPVTSSHYDVPEPERRKMGITFGLIRVSVGLEDAEDLIADFTQALKVFD
ncbi:MAG: aminotransferase class I/II-fold pyridoxal phosphate-dependent enzyme [Oscillospiraceae bacterium]|nr:aminotransferase class I/II-fold pyridoxal phosphate-dependent enzyme [Oscillospiraceae bacterium]